MEEDSLQGASKRRQLFTDFDTKEIYHQKNLDNSSQSIITINSVNFQLNDSFSQEAPPADVSQFERKFKETKSENVNIQDGSLTTNDPRLKESLNKEKQPLESNVLIQSKSNKCDELFPSSEKVYGINICNSKKLEENLSFDDSQFKSANKNAYTPTLNYDQIDELEDDEQSLRTRKILKKQEFLEVWQRLGSVLFNVKRFLKILKAQCSYFKYKVLMDHHSLHIIGDKSSYKKGDFDEQYEKSIFNQEEKSCIMKFSEPISPDEAIVLVWETYLLGILSMEMFIIPFRSCFKVNMAEISGLFVTLPMITYTFELIFNLNKGYFDQGNLITKRKLIIKRYFKKQFFIDVICIFSSLFYQTFQEFEYLGILFLIVRISQVQRLSTKLDESYQLQFKYPEATELIRLMLTIIFIAHVTGCGFHFLGMYISDSNYNWLEKYKIYHLPVVERYINSLYYAFITMVTVGYGDIVPISRMEKIYVICMTLISCGVFAYSVNTIGTIFRDLSKKSFHFKKINVKLQRRVLRALEYAEQQEQRGSQQGEYILKKVQTHLQNEIKQDFFGKILLSHKIFQLNFSKNFLKQLALKMNEKLLARDDILFQQGDIDENYYIVLSGCLEIFVMLQEQIYLGRILPGTGVGQKGFFTGTPRGLFVKSSEITRVVYIGRNCFLELIKNYPQDFERFCFLKDQILLEEKEFDTKCLVCHQFTHTILECPIISPKHDYQDDFLSKTISNRKTILTQPRRVYNRKNKYKYNILVNIHNIKFKLRQLRLKICGIETNKNSSHDVDENLIEEIYQNLNDFEFYMRLPDVKMIKSTYNDQLYELQVNNLEEQIIEDIPLLEYVQEFLKLQELTKSNDDRDTDYNDNTELLTNNLIINETSIANENNCGNINNTQNNDFIGLNARSPSNLISLDTQNAQLIPQNSVSNLKKSKTSNSLAPQKSNQKKQVSIDLDVEIIKDQQNQQPQMQNQNSTEIYFQQLEKKQNLTSFESDILNKYRQSILLLQSQKVCPSNTTKPSIYDALNAKTQYFNDNIYETLDYRDFPESPIQMRKQALMSQIQHSLSTIKSAMGNQYGDGSNTASNFITRTNRRKSTKLSNMNQNENQILNQLSKLNTNISNQITSLNSSEQLQDIKNSIKVHHLKLNQSDKNSNHTNLNQNNANQIANNNNGNVNQNASVHSKGNQSNRQEQIPSSSFKQIGIPSSNLINFNLKSKPSGLDELNNLTIAKSLQKQRSKISQSDQFWSIIDFEVFKSFQRYYPQNNIERVIQKYNNIQERKARIKSVKENKLFKTKTFIYLNRHIPHTPDLKCKGQKRRVAAEKSFLANVYNNLSISQMNKSGIPSERRKVKQKEFDSSSFIQSRQRKITFQSSQKHSSSDLGRLTEFVNQDQSIV